MAMSSPLLFGDEFEDTFLTDSGMKKIGWGVFQSLSVAKHVTYITEKFNAISDFVSKKVDSMSGEDRDAINEEGKAADDNAGFFSTQVTGKEKDGSSSENDDLAVYEEIFGKSNTKKLLAEKKQDDRKHDTIVMKDPLEQNYAAVSKNLIGDWWIGAKSQKPKDYLGSSEKTGTLILIDLTKLTFYKGDETIKGNFLYFKRICIKTHSTTSSSDNPSQLLSEEISEKGCFIPVITGDTISCSVDTDMKGWQLDAVNMTTNTFNEKYTHVFVFQLKGGKLLLQKYDIFSNGIDLKKNDEEQRIKNNVDESFAKFKDSKSNVNVCYKSHYLREENGYDRTNMYICEEDFKDSNGQWMMDPKHIPEYVTTAEKKYFPLLKIVSSDECQCNANQWDPGYLKQHEELARKQEEHQQRMREIERESNEMLFNAGMNMLNQAAGIASGSSRNYGSPGSSGSSSSSKSNSCWCFEHSSIPGGRACYPTESDARSDYNRFKNSYADNPPRWLGKRTGNDCFK